MQAEITYNIQQAQTIASAMTFLYTFIKYKHITCKSVDFKRIEEVKDRTFIIFTMGDIDYKVVMYEDKRGMRKFYMKPTMQDIQNTPDGYRRHGYMAAYNKPILIFGGSTSPRG